MSSPRLITPATMEPVSLDQVRAQVVLDADLTEDDALLEGYIATAREQAEAKTGAVCVVSGWEQPEDAFPASTRRNPRALIELGRFPVQAVTGITYVDPEGVEQTLEPDTGFQAVIQGQLGLAYACPPYGVCWPATRDVPEAVKISFTAGWPLAGDPQAPTTPRPIQHWILVQVATAYAHREAVVPGTVLPKLPREHVDGLLDPYTLVRV